MERIRQQYADDELYDGLPAPIHGIAANNEVPGDDRVEDGQQNNENGQELQQLNEVDNQQQNAENNHGLEDGQQNNANGEERHNGVEGHQHHAEDGEFSPRQPEVNSSDGEDIDESLSDEQNDRNESNGIGKTNQNGQEIEENNASLIYGTAANNGSPEHDGVEYAQQNNGNGEQFQQRDEVDDPQRAAEIWRHEQFLLHQKREKLNFGISDEESTNESESKENESEKRESEEDESEEHEPERESEEDELEGYVSEEENEEDELNRIRNSNSNGYEQEIIEENNASLIHRPVADNGASEHNEVEDGQPNNENGEEMQQRKEVKEYQRETARRKLKERIRWGPSDDEDSSDESTPGEEDGANGLNGNENSNQIMIHQERIGGNIAEIDTGSDADDDVMQQWISPSFDDSAVLTPNYERLNVSQQQPMFNFLDTQQPPNSHFALEGNNRLRMKPTQLRLSMKMLQQTKSNAQVEGVHNQQSSSPPSADKLNDIVTTEMARYNSLITQNEAEIKKLNDNLQSERNMMFQKIGEDVYKSVKEIFDRQRKFQIKKEGAHGRVDSLKRDRAKLQTESESYEAQSKQDPTFATVSFTKGKEIGAKLGKLDAAIENAAKQAENTIKNLEQELLIENERIFLGNMKPFIAKIKDFDDYEATINGELTNLAKEHAKVDKDRKDFLERHSLIDDDVIECKRPRISSDGLDDFHDSANDEFLADLANQVSPS